MSQQPRRSKANLHPGQIILDSQIQRRTSEQKQADDEALQQAKDAESAATQEAYKRVGMMESAMAVKQTQESTRSEKPVRPNHDHSKKTVEVGTGLGATKETDQEKEEFGPKAREKTILKLRSAIGQACKQVSGMETEWGRVAVNESGQGQLWMGPKPLRREETMVTPGGVIRQVCKPHSTAALSAHMKTTCEKSTANTDNDKSTIEGRVKNWNKVVLSATASKQQSPYASLPSNYTYPHCGTPISETPRRQWGFSDLDPPTPSENWHHEVCTSPIAVEADVFNTQHVDASNSTEDDGEHFSEGDSVNEEENAVVERIARGHQVTSKTFVTTIDADEPHKESRPTPHIIRHRVQKLRSSITPSVVSDSVPASDAPESEAMRTGNGSSRFTNTDLPPLFLKGRNLTFGPFLRTNLYTQEIIKVVYPTFTAFDDVCPNMPIFSVVGQRLSGWRHSFGSSAIALLDCYLASDPDIDRTEETCDALLCKRAFAYEDLDFSTPGKAFRGAFVLQLLANAHLRTCVGSVDVPVLHLSVKLYRARGAIALSMAATVLRVVSKLEEVRVFVGCLSAVDSGLPASPSRDPLDQRAKSSKPAVPRVLWEKAHASRTDRLIEWCRTHEGERKKLFSDSTQDAREEGRSKQQLRHGKNQIYIEMAKAIFLHDETDEFRALAATNPGVFASSIRSRLDVTPCLGRQVLGRTYEDLLSNEKTKNILAAITKDFPWWADLHGWWRTNPAYNNTFSAADVGQDFSARAVELFKLQPTPPTTDPEFHAAAIRDGEIEDDEDFSGSPDSQVSLSGPCPPCIYFSEQHPSPRSTITTMETISLNDDPPTFRPNRPKLQPSRPHREEPWNHRQKAASAPNTEESSDSDVVPSNFFSTLRVSSSSPSSPFISDDSDSKPSSSKQTRKRVRETPADRFSNSLTSASMSFVQHFQQSQQERSQVKRHRLDLEYWKAKAK
ncbi:hypothetical protein EDD15DRAFT_2205352, partial [Pisolithus albus]